jgi:electron transfer flavoprotein beta subunit
MRYPCATFASEITKTESGLNVTREVDGGLQVVSCELPAIVSCDLRLNTPRFASLPNIMKAKKKPVQVIKLEELGLTISGVTMTRVDAPKVR